MTWLEIEPAFQPLFRALRWASFDAVVEHFTHNQPARGETFVRHMTIDAAENGPVDVFFKQYRFSAPSWRFWFRASKARREYENYENLKKLGVPVAERVAAAETRDAMGRLRAAWIVTRAVPQSQTLVQFMSDQPAEEVRKQLVSELAAITRSLHKAGFVHHDLVWRNILVSTFGRRPKLFLIDCPRGRFARSRRDAQQIRDLASLDKSAVRHCRRGERLRFLLQYLGKTRLDDEARRIASACREYRRARWPDDWSGK